MCMCVSLYVFPYVALCFSLCVSFCVSWCAFLNLCMSMPQCVTLCVLVCLSLFICVPLCVSVCLCVSQVLYVSLYISLCLLMSLCLSGCLYASLCRALSFCVSLSLSVSARASVYLSIGVHMRVSKRLLRTALSVACSRSSSPPTLFQPPHPPSVFLPHRRRPRSHRPLPCLSPLRPLPTVPSGRALLYLGHFHARGKLLRTCQHQPHRSCSRPGGSPDHSNRPIPPFPAHALCTGRSPGAALGPVHSRSGGHPDRLAFLGRSCYETEHRWCL